MKRIISFICLIICSILLIPCYERGGMFAAMFPTVGIFSNSIVVLFGGELDD